MKRSKHIISSFSYPFDKQALIEEFSKVAERESKSFSDAMLGAMEEYVKKHGSGNPAYTVDKWIDQVDFKITPAYYELRRKWEAYAEKCNAKECEEGENQAIMIREIFQKYWLEKK